MKKILLIDLGHLAHRYLFAKSADIKAVGYGYLRLMLLSHGILQYVSQFKPDEVYIGVDYKKSWRKELTSTYKAQRAELREKSADTIDWEGFYDFLEKFIHELRDVFPFHVPLVAHLEADDIIGWLAKNLPEEHQKILVSGDGDYIQMLKYPNVKLWSPNRKGYVTGVDPERELMLKIICGDKSDNIKGCRRGVGVKKAIKLIETCELQKLLDEVDGDGNPCEFRRNFDRNTKLVDIELVPQGLNKRLQEHLLTYELADGSKFYDYLIKHGLREMIDNIEKFRNILKPLFPVKKISDVFKKCHLRSIS